MCAHNGYAFIRTCWEQIPGIYYNVKPYECVTVLHAHPSILTCEIWRKMRAWGLEDLWCETRGRWWRYDSESSLVISCKAATFQKNLFQMGIFATSFSAPLKWSHLWWLNCLSGCLISWYVVCLLSSGPSFPVCLLLFAALAGLSGLAIFNLLSQSAGDFELILLLLLVFLTLQMPLIGGAFSYSFGAMSHDGVRPFWLFIGTGQRVNGNDTDLKMKFSFCPIRK